MACRRRGREPGFLSIAGGIADPPARHESPRNRIRRRPRSRRTSIPGPRRWRGYVSESATRSRRFAAAGCPPRAVSEFYGRQFANPGHADSGFQDEPNFVNALVDARPKLVRLRPRRAAARRAGRSLARRSIRREARPAPRWLSIRKGGLRQTPRWNTAAPSSKKWTAIELPGNGVLEGILSAAAIGTSADDTQLADRV